MKTAPGSVEAIHAALEAKHVKDVIVGECNTGSTWNGCRRLDAWVMLKTWSPWTTIGYEIKVDRQDFLRDRKWVEYLPVCHEFYFVCPAKLIDPEELPPDVGLLWTTGGHRLQTKRKAVRRAPDLERLTALMGYVLMSRTRIVADMHAANRSGQDPAEFWREWLARKESNQQLGQEVSRRIREIVSKARTAAKLAEYEVERLSAVKAQLDALGLGDARYAGDVRRALGLVSDSTLEAVERDAQRIVNTLKNLRAQQEKAAADALRQENATAETELARSGKGHA